MPLESLAPTPDEAELVGSLCRELDRWADATVVAAEIDATGAIPPSVLRDLAELGLFGLTLPESHGGAELSLHATCSVVGALARHDRSVATTVGLHAGLGTRGLVRYGSEGLRDRLLPDLASGTRIAAFAATEPGAGSDLTAVSTRVLSSGTGHVAHGDKVYVTNGGLADVFTVLAATPGADGAHRGHGLAVVERGAPGLAVGPEEHKLGLRGSSTTTLHLDGAPAHLVGAPGQGMDMAAHVLAWGRTVMAAGATGAAGVALDAARAYTATRRQFGRPLDRFEVVRGQLADLTALHWVMEALVRHAASAPDDAALAALSASAKVFCSEGNWEICDTAVQLHGGMGFIEETGLPLLLRDARITRIFEGANDVLLVHAGLGALTDRTPGRDDPGADAVHRALLDRRDALTDRLGLRIARHQRTLHQLGRLRVLRDASDAAALRAREDATPRARALAAHFHAIAHDRLAPLLREPVPADTLDAVLRA